MANINRLLTVRKNPALNNFFSAIDDKFGNYSLGANTPILNHYLQTQQNFNDKPAILYLDKQPTEMLRCIRQLAQRKSVHRLERNKNDTPIEFICYGYLDHNGDIVLKNIQIPAYNKIRQTSKTISEAYEKLFNYIPNKVDKIEYMSDYLDFLRNTKLNGQYSIGRMPVAMLGTTKPIVSYSDGTENCPRFNELAKSIIPGDINFGEVMTGVLTVSPYSMTQTRHGLTFKDGSLEGVLTHYAISPTTGYSSPCNLTNLTLCKTTDSAEKFHDCEISNSSQPSINFPKILPENYKY